ncbi:zinc finger BED domain-containing protein 4-like isoform X2 [Paramisgurnus dabryanus]|uniref:zinc finger BED domain-containing protein 4-like isoform X2 n=1 Tax=Paramisgurnus dabryanus TaxID=90735 RepID=UPI003CCF5235
MNPEPSKTHTNNRRVSFELDHHRGNRHQRFSHGRNYSPPPNKRVHRQRAFSEGDDSNSKTLLPNIVKDQQPLNTGTSQQQKIQLNESSIQAEPLSHYRKKRLEVQNAVNAESNLVLSAELWSSNDTVFYLTVSCHLINENWMQQSYVLDTAHLLTERTAEHVLQQLMRISNEWNITDKIQVVVTNVDGIKKVDKSSCKWTFIPCFAHTLDKVWLETKRDSGLKPLFGKCQQIVAFFHQNIKASECLQKHRSHLKLQRNELIQSIDLKWLPTLHMLQNILELWPAINKVFTERQADNPSLNESEIKLLKDIVEVLNILKEMTKKIGTKDHMAISNIIPLVQKLQVELRNLGMTGNTIAQTLSEKCDYHIGNIKQNIWFRVSTALDPRHKTCLLCDSGVEDVKTEIRTEIRGNTQTVHSSYETSNTELILQKYWKIKITEDPLEFWKSRVEFEQLATIARKYLTVVSTAIPIERVHQLEQSQAINRRNWMDPKDLNMILFLNNNKL